MADDFKNLEQDKIDLEREKLAFEIKRYVADQTRRQLETAKLEEELRELRRPWYKKPAYLSPLAMIVVAIIGGAIAFGTDVFKSNVISLKKERDQLTTNVSALTKEKSHLSTENKKLQIESNERSKEVVTLKGEEEKLIKEKIRLQNANQEALREKEHLGREIMLVEMKTNVSILQAADQRLQRSNQSLENVLAIAERNSGNREFISLLEQAHNDSSSSELKAALCLALLRVTKNPKWKTQLKESSLGHLIETMDSDPLLIRGWSSQSIYLSLLREKTVFTLAERVQTLKTLYDKARNKLAHMFNPDLLFILAHWDEDAVVVFRDPWFDYLGHLYVLQEWRGPIIGGFPIGGFPISNKLLKFSSQAFGIMLVKEIAEGEITSLRNRFNKSILSKDLIIETGIFDINQCDAFPTSFPLRQDCTKPEDKLTMSIGELSKLASITPITGISFVIGEARLPAYRQWINENKEMVSIWTDRSFSKLKSCSDEEMRRLIRGKWIGISDFKASK